MKPEFSLLSDLDCSCLQIEVQVTEAWIDGFLAKQQLSVPVTDQFNLSNLRIDLSDSKLALQADIVEKEGSSVKVTCLPVWDLDTQYLQLEEIDVKLYSKNILLKSAGWFAKTFMGAKIDKKIEKAANQVYAHQIKTILEEGLNIPVRDGGRAMVQVRSITITEMTFNDHSIKVRAMIDGYWKLHLGMDH